MASGNPQSQFYQHYPPNAGKYYFDSSGVSDTSFCIPCNAESFLYNQDVQTEFEDGEEPTEEISDPVVPPNVVEVEESPDKIPITLAVAKSVNDQKGHYIYRALMDHGGSHTLVKRSTLPPTPRFSWTQIPVSIPPLLPFRHRAL